MVFSSPIMTRDTLSWIPMSVLLVASCCAPLVSSCVYKGKLSRWSSSLPFFHAPKTSFPCLCCWWRAAALLSSLPACIKGQYKFKCPALEDGTLQKCDEEWSYQEVRRLAVLTAEEMQYFEEKMALLAATEYCDFKECPGCKTYMKRKNPSNLSVRCTVCTEDNKKAYEFCWQCLKLWKGAAPRSDRCDNDGCINLDLEALKNCGTTNLSQVQGVDACPSLRACPTCGLKVAHDTTGCKNIICPRCQIEFCFVCLKLTPECLKTSSYFIACSDGVAPIQTSIPVWHRN